MDKWTSTARKQLRHGESQKGEGTRWRRSGRETARTAKMQAREKVGKSQNIVFSQCFVVPAGQKISLLKRRVRSELARREMKRCTPL